MRPGMQDSAFPRTLHYNVPGRIFFSFFHLGFWTPNFHRDLKYTFIILMLIFSFERRRGDKQYSTLSLLRDISMPFILRIKIVISVGQKQFLSPAECLQ